ncbi:hypothetical protein PCASD_07126 [Puccinia coronata f. sp. avenae]|uniref:Uncharacterized protein n=1 Tax=Puccinia coronata f. sp. avenae TaxID=200324 RepID=A0A2N5V4B4_9BASI|nr:hypothetical protein PCASD_07126 [Puccinia coronata f. sp. avenae]
MALKNIACQERKMKGPHFTGWQRRCRRQAGTSLSQLAEALFLGKQVPACTCSPKNSFLAGWYKLVPPRQGVLSCRAGQSLYRLAEE